MKELRKAGREAELLINKTGTKEDDSDSGDDFKLLEQLLKPE